MNDASQNSKTNTDNWHTVSYMRDGKPEQVAVELPANGVPDQTQEAAEFVQTLEDNQQIQHHQGPLTAGKTHQIIEDVQGNKRLKRIRYSAI